MYLYSTYIGINVTGCLWFVLLMVGCAQLICGRLEVAIKRDIKIVLIETHTIFRDGIQKLFEAEEGFSIIGEAGDGLTGVTMVFKLRPDIVLLGIDLPRVNGIEITRRIATNAPSINVIALSAHSSDECVINFFGAGGRGFVTKNGTFSDLKSAIYAVIQGNKYFSVEVASIVVDTALDPFSSHHKNNQSPLSHREREILQLISEGETSIHIAKMLGISKRTVDNHRKNILDKLEIHRVANLTRYAIVNKLTFLP